MDATAEPVAHPGDAESALPALPPTPVIVGVRAGQDAAATPSPIDMVAPVPAPAVRVQTAISMQQVAEPYIRNRAVRHLEKGRVVIFACGTGNPFFSTDTAAALRAVEIGADAILLAKNVDGVYDSDPRVNPEAKLLPDVTYQQVQERDLKVMDASAITICRENKVPCIRVFGLDDPQNILRVVMGEPIGTIVKEEL